MDLHSRAVKTACAVCGAKYGLVDRLSDPIMCPSCHRLGATPPGPSLPLDPPGAATSSSTDSKATDPLQGQRPSRTRRGFAIFGYVCAGILAVFVVLAAIFIPRALHLEHDGAAYLDHTLPGIVGTWDSHALASRATPELLGVVKAPADLERVFRFFKQLGKLKHIDEPTGSVYTGTYLGKGTVTTGNFTAKAEFENGPATISVQLTRVGDSWEYNGLHINSPVFLPK